MLAPHWRWNSAAARHANPEELASFLAFCGCGSVILDEGVCPPPTGWHRAETLTVFGLAPGKVLPLPAVEDALWSSLTLDAQPPAMTVAQAPVPQASVSPDPRSQTRISTVRRSMT